MKKSGFIFVFKKYVLPLHAKSKADMAQLVEHFIRNERVRGSSPRVGSKGKRKEITYIFFLFCYQIPALLHIKQKATIVSIT